MGEKARFFIETRYNYIKLDSGTDFADFTDGPNLQYLPLTLGFTF